MDSPVKIELECLNCGYVDQLAWRTTDGMKVRRCQKCKQTDLLFTKGIYGVITNKAENIRKIKASLTERDTDSWRYLQRVMEEIRAKMANGKRSEKLCVFCDNEPHSERRPCQCFCHEVKAFVQRVKGPGDGELEQRVA